MGPLGPVDGAAHMGDVGVVAVAQAVEHVVADADLLRVAEVVEDPGPLERGLGVPVLVVVAGRGVLRVVPVGQRAE